MSNLHLPKRLAHISHDLHDSDPGAWAVSALGAVLLILILAAFFLR